VGWRRDLAAFDQFRKQRGFEADDGDALAWIEVIPQEMGGEVGAGRDDWLGKPSAPAVSAITRESSRRKSASA
jgi:hypothetical protein